MNKVDCPARSAGQSFLLYADYYLHFQNKKLDGYTLMVLNCRNGKSTQNHFTHVSLPPEAENTYTKNRAFHIFQ